MRQLRRLDDTHLPLPPFLQTRQLSSVFDMVPNTKYQAASQRDSFDEPSPSYTQAPPSYQAEPSYTDAPRGEDDNVPDDFKVRLAARLVLFSGV